MKDEKGYGKLARFMCEKEHIIVKQYRNLAVRDLLYRQAEICQLEHEFNLIAQKDAEEKDERQFYDRHWWILETSKERGFHGEQWDSALKIRKKLEEYYASVLQYRQIASLPPPKESERQILENWIDSKSLGGHCGFLGIDLAGFENAQPSAYAQSNLNDLLKLSNTRGEDDLFTNICSGPILNLFHRLWQHRKKPLPIDPENPSSKDNQSSLYHYSDTHVQTATNILGTVASSIIPLTSIIVLYYVKNMGARLGLVCLFTILFSLGLALATKARRIEIFTATAAFASVQVVFIGTTSA